jgi:AraC family transcriptional regulator of adaptative response/methylated-DNA-[protein]-cysteine methyltransferase
MKQIDYRVGDSDLGSVLVAVCDQAVCAILLGDDADSVVESLQQQWPNADLIASEHALQTELEQVMQLIDDPNHTVQLKLALKATAFQRSVWSSLQQIPVGSTWSYQQLAAAINRPKAVRAVANACAANRHALVIPCHRVLRADGDLSGYRWGVTRKQALLERELRA